MNKKILYISNMYPSKKYKHYGSFVKNMENDIRNLGYQIDKVVMTKQDFLLLKLVSYLVFYTTIFVKSLLHRYDIIYVHFISHSAHGIIKKDAKLFLHAHGNDVVPDTKKDEKNVSRSQKALKKADFVVVPSTYFKDVMMQDYQVEEEKIYVYPSGGVSFDLFYSQEKKKAQEKVGLNPKYQYIGMISRIEKDKGWDTLIEAISILKKQGNFKDKKLLIVGTGEEQPLLEEEIKKNHLEEDIIQKEFAYQQDLVYYYNALDLFVLPTKRKSESLGLVGLEAMACKIPCVICTLYGPRTYAKSQNALTYQQDVDGTILASKIQEFFALKEVDKQKMIQNAFLTSKEYG